MFLSLIQGFQEFRLSRSSLAFTSCQFTSYEFMVSYSQQKLMEESEILYNPMNRSQRATRKRST